MEYSLHYCFKGKHYSIKRNVPQKAYNNQLEAIAEGLALSSAELNNHSLYGKYTNLSLFENGEIVWHSELRIITKNYSYNLSK